MGPSPRRSPITMPGYRTGQPAPNKGMELPGEVYSEAEVLALLGACSRRGSAGLRDRALIVVLWRTGLRISEALALAPRDVNLELGTVTVLHGKGDRRRTVGIDAQAAVVLERWLQRRRELGIPRSWEGRPSPLFCVITEPRRGKPIYASVFREKLKDLARKAGVERRVHPHGFRHTCAVDMHHREAMPVQLVQKQLGHARLDTTARYLDHLSPAQLVDAMRVRRWGEQRLEAPASPDDVVRAELGAVLGRLAELEQLVGA